MAVRSFRVLLAAALLILVGRELALAQPTPDDGLQYGKAGTSEVNILLGFSSGEVAFGGGFRHFVVDRVAPGLEASVTRADGLTRGFTFASVRLVPFQVSSVALVLTARTGRVFLSDHIDGWAYGGDAGVLIFFSQHAGLELGYEVLKLAPGSFCADLSTCLLQRPVLGVRIVF